MSCHTEDHHRSHHDAHQTPAVAAGCHHPKAAGCYGQAEEQREGREREVDKLERRVRQLQSEVDLLRRTGRAPDQLL